MTDMNDILGRFAARRVLVIGDAMLDVYLRGGSSRLCPEAPAPIVDLHGRTVAAGGAANTALNVAALGAEATLLAGTGTDISGGELVTHLKSAGVDTSLMQKWPGRRTLTKMRIQSGSQLVARIDQGDFGPLNEDQERRIIQMLWDTYASFDAVIVSDYGYGVLSEEVIAALAECQKRSRRVLVGDSKCLQRFRGVEFRAIKPNYSQAVHLLGACPVEGRARIDQMRLLGPTIFDLVDTEIVALTLDQDGAILLESGCAPVRTRTTPNPHTQAAGAGDTYVAALTLALATGASPAAAGEIAAAAASVVVCRDGTSNCTIEELRQKLGLGGDVNRSLETLLPRLDADRRHGKQIVLTNGCFDILHCGHIRYLNEARSLGDLLVVGVNSDASIQRLKGADRPINRAADRVEVLSSLRSVDHVVIFEEDTPHRLVRAIRPDIFVKGGDYTRDRLPEAALVEELGGRVEILSFLQDRSTTNLIRRIRSDLPGHNGHSFPHSFTGSPVLTSAGDLS